MQRRIARQQSSATPYFQSLDRDTRKLVAESQKTIGMQEAIF